MPSSGDVGSGAATEHAGRGLVTASTQAELAKSFSSAADTASRYPAWCRTRSSLERKTAFLQGDQWAYTAGLVAILLGAVLVFFCFPKRQEEEELLARYRAEDTSQPARATDPDPGAVGLPAPGGPA